MGLHRDDSSTPEDAGKKAGERSDLSREVTAATPAPGAGSRGTPAGSIASGTMLDHFEILELLGAGGFGEVYRARDTRLGRMVAIKVLPEAFFEDEERRIRFEREARALASLNHSCIAAIHSFEEIPGSSPSFTRHLIVMELVEGKTLHALLANGPLSVEGAIPIALQIADALAEAHRAGIVHRDIKSGNIALTERGQVKVLDFGLAKLFGKAPEQAEGSTMEKLTAEGASLGTITHMSPEQLLGRAVDRRSDLFSFGVVLYEMVTGRLPFEGSTAIAVADAILHAEPRDFDVLPQSGKLKAIIRKLLEKDPAKRYASAEEVHADLKALEASLAPARPGGLSRNARIAIAAAVVVAAAAAGWLWHRASRARWALETATPEAARLVEAEEFAKAAALIREARAVLPKDPTLEKLWMRATGEASIETLPTGADVSIGPYRGDESAWESLGQTPLKKVRVPGGLYVWRIAKPGFVPTLFMDRAPLDRTFKLPLEGGVPPGMVPVPGGDIGLGHPHKAAPKVRLDDFLIDRHEVTNEEYKRFVDSRGYERKELWKEPFVKDGRMLPWEEAVALLRDTTGRPGPATWEVGGFPRGRDKHPVAGVSWYEAAAFAEFVGKSLPTAYHWTRASQPYFAALIVPGSNFRGEGTQPVGGPGTLSGFGTTDMAGNAKEWCWNESWAGKRFLLGGGFGEPTYMFYQTDAQSPWDRRANYGFRCVKLSTPPPPEATARVEPVFRDFSKEKPVSNELFAAFKGLYAYEKEELNAKVEDTKTTADWVWEKVSFNAAYGGERVTAHVFLPKNAAPPFQTIVYFPDASAMSIEKFDASLIQDDEDFVPKSGRALVLPIYKSTFERQDEWKPGGKPAMWRDHLIMWSKDLGRSLDYLKTRKDVDGSSLAYLGFSWGSAQAPVHLAIDERFKTAILLSGGLYLRPSLPEADAINFVTRVTIPVLMLNDRYDDFFPLETSQRPLFRLLGTPDKDKRQIIYESGHGGLPHREMVRESLDWLDKYLGPVKR